MQKKNITLGRVVDEAGRIGVVIEFDLYLEVSFANAEAENTKSSGLGRLKPH